MNKEILKLAIPNILANLSVPIVSLVDVSLMGHLSSEAFILAIGFGVMIFNFIYWGFGFLRMGVTGITAQNEGKKDIDETFRVLFRGLIVAITGALLLFIFKPYLLELALYLIDSSPNVNEEITTYFNVRIFAAPATIGLYAFIGWFMGKQNAVIPMIITIAVNIINAGLSYYLVSHYNMGTTGVAIGTVIAQYTGLVLAIVFFITHYLKQITHSSFNGVFQYKAIRDFLLVNSDIFIRTLCLIFTLSFFKIYSGKEGLLIGAANILLLEFIGIAAYGIDGFAFAAESISGKYFGANDKFMLKKAIKYCFYWGFALGFSYALVFLFLGEHLLYLLSSQAEVVEIAKEYLWWLVLFPILSVIPFVWDGVFIGITASKAMRNTMLFATFIVFLPTYYILHPYLNNNALWAALILFIVARGLAQSVIAKKVIYKKAIKKPR
ncbi:MATE family efflux transporter [Vicingus serpentipes]|uniref:MATE family efflux transporter n=1 Tax=Vicingus serpentipes TaxID=1926625 RepID=A0A5C6RRN9_9FLAO|nr:MATE family efflux transporter [Vicingus serpentipes]TXB65076.1 MATE family efflux transporter [Vicingus serpentipes]